MGRDLHTGCGMKTFVFNTPSNQVPLLASYPGLLTPVFVACSINTGESLVKLIMCSDIPGCWVDVEEWHIPRKPQVSGFCYRSQPQTVQQLSG